MLVSHDGMKEFNENSTRYEPPLLPMEYLNVDDSNHTWIQLVG